MKLCFLHGGFHIHGGIERVISIVAPALEEREIAEVRCISLVKTHPLEMYHLPDRMHTDYLFSQQINMRNALLKGGIAKLVKYIKKHQIEAIVACGVIYFPLACIAGKIAGVNVLCWEHTHPENENKTILEIISRSFGAAVSDWNILISNGAYDYYCTHYRKSRNVIINNPAANELFTDPYRREHPDNAFVSVGRLTDQKNFPLLIDIAEKILKGRTDWRWDIYGDGEQRIALERKITELGLEEKVFLKGNVSDLYDRYPQYAAIVMTSRYEGFPMVLIEAAAKGLPMVSFDIETGPSEIIRDGVNGFLIPQNDIGSMIDRLELIMDNSALCSQMSSAAKESVEPFRLNAVCAQWQMLLQELGKQIDEKNNICN